jgi:hypothetical protein
LHDFAEKKRVSGVSWRSLSAMLSCSGWG